MTVKHIVELFEASGMVGIDAYTVVHTAKGLVKNKTLPPNLVQEFSQIKSASSNVTPQAAQAIMTEFGFDPTSIVKDIWLCELDPPSWLTEPFILDSERNQENFWRIPKVEKGSWMFSAGDITDLR